MSDVHPITVYRDQHDLTLEEFGAVFTVDKSTVKRWEAGNIPAERARSISDYTGIPLHHLRADLWPAPEATKAAE